MNKELLRDPPLPQSPDIQEELEGSISKILKKIKDFERKDIVVQLRELFGKRILNEYYVSLAIESCLIEAYKSDGGDTDASIRDAIEMLKSSKDSLGVLGTTLRLFEDKTTSKSEVEGILTVEHKDIENRLSMLN